MEFFESLRIKLMSTPEYLKCISYEQNNPHHYLPLDLHMQKVEDDVAKNAPWSDRLRFAAMFHDIGKPDCASLDPKTGYSHYCGHAARSAEIAAKLLVEAGFSEQYVSDVCWYIRHHDDFISFKVGNWKRANNDDHPFLRDVNVQNVAEVICKAHLSMDKDVKEIDKNATARYIITGVAPSWGRVVQWDTLPYVPSDDLFDTRPTLTAFTNLLFLCKADANAQSQRDKKIAVLNSIESLLSEAYELAMGKI